VPLIDSTPIIAVRGGGDLGTGVVQKLCRAGFRVVVLETYTPVAIRRSVALSEAVYDGTAQVEDVSCRKIAGPDELEDCWHVGSVPLLVDPGGQALQTIQPTAVIDAILAKRNLGTHRAMASITIALGPGFCAGKDVDIVIETLRGHDLGKLIFEGYAAPDTGIPGMINGKDAQRVLRAPSSGMIIHNKSIGSVVEQGEILFTVSGTEVQAPFIGLVRGLIREGVQVHKGMKVADIDPRTDIDWRSISDKARCIGGAVLEAFLYLVRKH